VPMLWDGIIRRDPSKITEALREMGSSPRPIARQRKGGRAGDWVFQRRFLEQMTMDLRVGRTFKSTCEPARGDG